MEGFEKDGAASVDRAAGDAHEQSAERAGSWAAAKRARQPLRVEGPLRSVHEGRDAELFALRRVLVLSRLA